jgi:hypothetical protein
MMGVVVEGEIRFIETRDKLFIPHLRILHQCSSCPVPLPIPVLAYADNSRLTVQEASNTNWELGACSVLSMVK